MRYWWLSFADAERPEGAQFLGAVIIAASRLEEALKVAEILHCNPGGEVRFVAFETVAPLPAMFVGHLFDRAEAEGEAVDAAVSAVLLLPS